MYSTYLPVALLLGADEAELVLDGLQVERLCVLLLLQAVQHRPASPHVLICDSLRHILDFTMIKRLSERPICGR